MIKNTKKLLDENVGIWLLLIVMVNVLMYGRYLFLLNISVVDEYE